MQDITVRRQFQDELSHRALHDPLTGLPNRALFLDRLGHALVRARAAPGEIAVLFLDLDHFKLANDGMGHLAGDAVLIEVARRLSDAARAEDTVARFGGDEFTILLRGRRRGRGEADCRARPQRLAPPVRARGRRCSGSRASIGIRVSSGRRR